MTTRPRNMTYDSSTPRNNKITSKVTPLQLSVDNTSCHRYNYCSNYLQTEIGLTNSLPSSPEHKNHWAPSRKVNMEPMAIRKIKQQYRDKRKKLVIQNCQSPTLQHESHSLFLTKGQSSSLPRKFKTISSQKNNKAEQIQLSNSLSKKLRTQPNKTEQKRCDLINTILQRYKSSHEKEDFQQKTSSTNISSIKLFKRQEQTQNKTNIKFFPRRGCPPGKLTRECHLKRQKKLKQKCIEPCQQKHKVIFRWDQISPWEISQQL